jgi:hypothetical protein
MKRSFPTLRPLIAALLPLLLVSCAGTRYVPAPPPAPLAQTVPPRPGGDRVWIEGHWTWNGRRYVWVNGRWAPGDHEGRWIDGRWEKRPSGWLWIPGHYESRP